MTFVYRTRFEAVKFWIEKYPNCLDRFPQEFAIQGLKLVLENNTFNFGNI